MITAKILQGKQVYLRQIELSDCTDNYVRWLNDKEVNSFLETKWNRQDLKSITEFVESQRKNSHSILFAIILRESDRHIGNIKIGPVSAHYSHADISYFIGEKNYWKRGIATEAVSLICDFAFHELKLHKVEAGTYDCALGSRKALERNGFKEEGRVCDHIMYQGKYMDMILYGKINSCDTQESSGGIIH